MVDVVEDNERQQRLRLLNAKRQRDDAAREAAAELSDAELLEAVEGAEEHDIKHIGGAGAIPSGADRRANEGIGGVLEGAGAGTGATSDGSSSGAVEAGTRGGSSTILNNATATGASTDVEGQGSESGAKKRTTTQSGPKFHFTPATTNHASTSGASDHLFSRQNAVDESAEEGVPIDIDGANIVGTGRALNVDLIWSNNKPPQLIRRPARASGCIATSRIRTAAAADLIDENNADDNNGSTAPKKRRRLARKPTESGPN